MTTLQKTSPMRLRFAVAALAFILAGCPNPGAETVDKEQDKQSQTTDPQDSQEPAPPVVHTLGLVSATIQEARYEVGPTHYRLPLPLGHFRAKDAPEPSPYLDLIRLKERPDGAAGQYVSAYSGDDTHRFYIAPLAPHLDALSITLGGQAATWRRAEGNTLVVGFPAEAQGDLVVTVAPMSDLHFPTEVYDPSAYKTFAQTTVVSQAAMMAHYAAHDATASLSVAVHELNGDPSTGLTASNFRIETSERPAVTREAKESAAGVYQIKAAFDSLYGAQASRRSLTLEVVNPSIREEVKP